MPQTIEITKIPVEHPPSWYEQRSIIQYVTDLEIESLGARRESKLQTLYTRSRLSNPEKRAERKLRREIISFGILGSIVMVLSFCAGSAAAVSVPRRITQSLDQQTAIIAFVALLGLAVEAAAGVLWFAIRTRKSSENSGQETEVE